MHFIHGCSHQRRIRCVSQLALKLQKVFQAFSSLISILTPRSALRVQEPYVVEALVTQYVLTITQMVGLGVSYSER